MIKLVSWNVNGFRAILKKGFSEWLYSSDIDILGLQEIKVEPEQLSPEERDLKNYSCTWNPSRMRKGYSGTSLFSKLHYKIIDLGLGIPLFDNEGRTIVADYGDFVFLTVYFPNGESSPERLRYKLDFYDAFFAYILELKQNGRSVIFCGDVNTAHAEIDLSHPKENSNKSGFLPIERSWIDKLHEAGFIDTFRYKYPNLLEKYSWWSYRTRARSRNIGWRIDYFFLSEDLLPRLKDAFIYSDVMGSDHCPVGIILE